MNIKFFYFFFSQVTRLVEVVLYYVTTICAYLANIKTNAWSLLHSVHR